MASNYRPAPRRVGRSLGEPYMGSFGDKFRGVLGTLRRDVAAAQIARAAASLGVDPAALSGAEFRALAELAAEA